MGGGITSPWTGEIGGSGGDYDPSLIFSKQSQVGGSQKGTITRTPVQLEIKNTGLACDSLHIAANDLIYVGDSSFIKIFDARDPNSMTQVGVLDLTSYLTNSYDIQVQGSYAYLIDIGTSFVKLDIDDPANIIFVDKLTVSGNIGSFRLSGHYAFITHATNRLSVVDIRDMTLVSEQTLTTFGTVRQTFCQGRYLVCLVGTGVSLVILDRSDIENIVEVGRVATGELNALGMHLNGDIAFICGTDYIVAYDISVKSNPILVAGSRYENLSFGEIRDMTLIDNYLYAVASDTNTLGVINYTDLSSPALLGDLIIDASLDNARQIKSRGNLLFTVAATSNKLVSWDSNGYYFPSVVAGTLSVQNEAFFRSNIKAARQLDVNGDVTGRRGYFQRLQDTVALNAVAVNINQLGYTSNSLVYYTLCGNLIGLIAKSFVSEIKIEYFGGTGPVNVGDIVQSSPGGGLGVVTYNDNISVLKVVSSINQTGFFKPSDSISTVPTAGHLAVYAVNVSNPSPVTSEFKYTGEEKILVEISGEIQVQDFTGATVRFTVAKNDVISPNLPVSFRTGISVSIQTLYTPPLLFEMEKNDYLNFKLKRSDSLDTTLLNASVVVKKV
jgi:hypothetical protein